MARRLSQSDPALSINFFNSGFYTYRSQLFSPYKGIGVNVVSFHDPVIDGRDFELIDKFEWQRRPGFSIFCPIPLADFEVVRQFYSSRVLNGNVYSFVDTSARLAIFDDTSLTTVSSKTTTAQGFPTTVGNMTYYSDGASADYFKWEGANVSSWGLAAPTTSPIASGMGFWQPQTSSNVIGTILDNNGNVEAVSRALNANGTFSNPASYSVTPIAGGGGNGGVAENWAPYSTYAADTATYNSCFSYYLNLQDFNLHIPSNATITGIEVVIYKFGHQDVPGFGEATDRSVQLIIGGVVSGTNESVSGNWNTSGFFSTLYGGRNNLWGLSPTPADINANGLSGFGIALTANLTTSAHNFRAVVGTSAPFAPIVTVYYTVPSGTPSAGISGQNEPNWPISVNSITTDGSLSWTNFGEITTWYPNTNYPTPVVVLDTNGFLQVGVAAGSLVAPWDSTATYAVGDIVSFGGSYWISLVGSNSAVAPSLGYSTTSGGTVTPYWGAAASPIVTGYIAPVWNTTINGTTADGQYTWTNIGQGTALATVGYSYVYGFRTVYGHLTTCSEISNNTGAIFGPLNASISSFAISGNVVTFQGSNNFIVGNVFTVRGLTVGTYLNNQSFTVLSAVSSATFPLTEVAVNGSNVLTITALNNLVAGQQVTFSSVAAATFLNGQTVTVLSSGLSGTQFEANFTHASYGPTADTGNVTINGNWTAAFTHTDVMSTNDSGEGLPLIATITGNGCGSPLTTSNATITAVSVLGNVVTIIASNNFQPGIWVTLTGLTNATFLNNQQPFQVIGVDKLPGTLNTQFQVFFQTPDYMQTSDTGVATFNAIEIYRTSDGGGLYLFDGAVTDPGAGAVWTFNDFVVDADLDIELQAPLNHQNDPPPGAAGSTIMSVGTISTYWQGRLWLVVGNYVYFDAGPDCTNGIPEESWPPSYRFQFAGPVRGLKKTSDGTGLLVYLADRVNVILGGPETISFYPDDALGNFGVSSVNALFRDGSIVGQFTTQKQYMELLGTQKNDIGEHIGDYLSANVPANAAYVAMHRDGLDVGVFISNGTNQVLRFGSNISAWSVPYYPIFGAGACQSVETAVGTFSLMLATPNGGVTATYGPANPVSGISVTGSGLAWVNPSNITIGNPLDYATVTFAGAGVSQVLRSSGYITIHTGSPVFPIPNTAVVQGVRVTLVGKQTVDPLMTTTITPTNAVGGATFHTFSFGSTNTTIVYGSATDLWGMPWSIPATLNNGALSFDIKTTYTGVGTPEFEISQVIVQVTYQNPGNYLYARDLNSWCDCGIYGENNGTSYPLTYITIGSITLSELGAPMFPLQHVCGYFDGVGTLDNGGPSIPDIWILPNEINTSAGIGFVYLPEALPEPPIGQNHISKTILARRWPLNMMNSNTASQYIHTLQLKIQFEPENAPNTIKAVSFKELQD